MPGLLPDVDPDGLLEYSVVYTDRALNHMSGKFQGVMRDISAVLKEVYGAHAVAIETARSQCKDPSPSSLMASQPAVSA